MGSRLAAIVPLLALILLGCSDEQQPRERTEQVPNTDAAGREQERHASLRVDVGGDEDLREVAMAAADVVERAFPEQRLTWEASHYGRSTWGICLGSSEGALVRDRAGWGIETCEKSGIRILSAPITDEVQLAVSDRAAVRPEVALWARTTIAEAADPQHRSRARASFDRFLADARAAGVTPIVG